MIDKTRLKERVLELVRIDSLSRKERAIALRLKEILEALGGAVFMDDAGTAVGGEVGNLVAHFDGNVAPAPSRCCCRRIWTRWPRGEGVTPVVDGDVIRSGRTDGVGRRRQERHRHHPGSAPGRTRGGLAPRPCRTWCFTICEEVGLLGAKHLDLDLVRAKTGLVLDSDSIGFLITKAPAVNHLEFEVHGLEAHAGICPERGISAIQVALPRYHRHAARPHRRGHHRQPRPGERRHRREHRAEPGDADGRSTQPTTKRSSNGRRSRWSRVCRTPRPASRWSWMAASTKRAWNSGSGGSTTVWTCPLRPPSFGAFTRRRTTWDWPSTPSPRAADADANVLNKRGLQVANLASGMRDIHTVHEWLDVNDLVTAARIIHEVVRLEGPPGVVNGQVTGQGP